jgi:serine/threonine protein kinase
VEAGARAFLVMELLQGTTLRDELRAQKRLSASRTIQIFRGVCSAVEAAHDLHIIHRDLKPENIFLARTGDGGGEVLKVLDFGIAKFLPAGEDVPALQTDGDTEAGVLDGTPGYISPEQLLGERPSVSWDLWALAVTVYETLTGSLPFPAASSGKWRLAVLAGAHAPLHEYLALPPEPWEEFFARTLAPDRAMRPRSAVEFFRHLEQALA